MKRVAVGFALLLGVAASIFAQNNDLTTLAVIKLNKAKTETITLKQLKTRADYTTKQYEAAYGITLTAEQKSQMRDQVLTSLIDEKLITQAAAKDGLSVTDSQVDAAFLNQISQQNGIQLTEAQVEQLVQQQYKKSLGDYIRDETGMTITEYKASLKNQILVQQYVYSKKQNELQKIAATDEEIRNFYKINQKNFSQNELIKLFLVLVPKTGDDVEGRAKATDLRNKYVKDNNTKASIIAGSNSKDYVAREQIFENTSVVAQQLGWSTSDLLELFNQSEGYVSEIRETKDTFQFYAVVKKYEAKILQLSDVVRPDTTITIYDYIKNNITSQKQMQYYQTAVQEIIKELDTQDNVDRKKTGADLTKLLNW